MTDKPIPATRTGGLKLIGAGFGRTGTLSLKAALEELGLGPCYHMIEVFGNPKDVPRWEAAFRGELIDWNEIFEGYSATVDWPSCAFYEELMQAYPDAKVLLSVRDPKKWYESVSSTIYRTSRMAASWPLASVFFFVRRMTVDPKMIFDPHKWRTAGQMRHAGRMVNTIIWEGTFGGNFEDRDHAIAVFDQHIEAVKQRVPPDRLLVYNVKEGWEPLCTFLGVEVPTDKPFPHLNDRANFIGNRSLQPKREYLVGGLLVASMLAAVLLFLRSQSKR